MEYFGYRIIPKSPELVTSRRVSLDWYANIAQLSQLTILLIIPSYKLFYWYIVKLLEKKDNTESTLNLDSRRSGRRSGRKDRTAMLARTARICKFKLGTEVAKGYGTYGKWIFGLLWGAWLGVLCVAETFPDFVHLIKRFALIAASQLPIHCLITVKHPYSPLLFMLKSSHEAIISWHEVMGKIIIFFFGLHVSLYINIFVQMGMFWKVIRQSRIAVGLVSAGIFFAIWVTSTGYFRRVNYAGFYTIHVIGSAAVTILLFFHVDHIRIYLWESVAVLSLNAALRMFTSRKFEAVISTLPQSNGLVKVSIQSPGRLMGRWMPGEHVYLCADPLGIMSYFAKNPFTIATLPTDDQNIVLVARCRNGNTKRLFATSELADGRVPSTLTISLEGPYGYSRYLDAPGEFSRVLFIAGGVGATYIVPLWRSYYQARTPNQEIRLVWAVKTIKDAEWAFEYMEEATHNATTEFQVDERQLSVTGNKPERSEDGTGLFAGGASDLGAGKAGFMVSPNRPDLKMLVDMTVFGNTGRSAVFVCGPNAMVTSVRGMVGKVIDSKDVLWHAENF